ncbi:hypothetical protein [uncultured Shewanella sp.]|uniref:hypothetical protein n=1 Tax=uncultured Shewanella sp. TaxID=173975 RepID=UPI002632DA04|nr:hypothetical protein [uncultured Shewanella sp.]
MIIRSLFEVIKWPIFVFTFVYSVLLTVSMSSDALAIAKLALSIISVLVLLSFQHSIHFVEGEKSLRYFIGFKLFNTTIFAFESKTITYTNIDKVELQVIHQTPKVKVYCTDDPEHNQSQLIPLTTRLWLPKNKRSVYSHKLKTALVSQGLNCVGSFDAFNEKRCTSFSSVNLDSDTVNLFKRPLINHPIITTFPVFMAAMPLPAKLFHQIRLPFYLACALGLLFMWSSQNWQAALVAIVFGVLGSVAMHMIKANRYFHCPGQGPSELVVEQDALSVPALFFLDRKTHSFAKGEIKKIDITWNWYIYKDSNIYSYSTAEKQKYPYIFEVIFTLVNGEQHRLPGHVFQSNDYVVALYDKGYSVELSQIDQLPMKWRMYILIPMTVGLSIMLCYGLYRLFIVLQT